MKCPSKDASNKRVAQPNFVPIFALLSHYDLRTPATPPPPPPATVHRARVCAPRRRSPSVGASSLRRRAVTISFWSMAHLLVNNTADARGMLVWLFETNNNNIVSRIFTFTLHQPAGRRVLRITTSVVKTGESFLNIAQYFEYCLTL